MCEELLCASAERKARQPIRSIVDSIRRATWQGEISDERPDKITEKALLLAEAQNLQKELSEFGEAFFHNCTVHPPKKGVMSAMDSMDALDSYIAKAGLQLKKEPKKNSQ